ncbi:MAG: hypothetical protein Q9223_004107 [Gallowayella weberi]
MDRWANTIWRQPRLMDRGAPDQYSQSDPASAAQYTPQPDVRSSTYAAPATPTTEFGVNPSSARSTSLNQDYLARQQSVHSRVDTRGTHPTPITAGLSSTPDTRTACPEDRTALQEVPFQLGARQQRQVDRGQARCTLLCRSQVLNSTNALDAGMKKSSVCTNADGKEFKEIRKEWKQRKKEEEAQRKSEDERQRGSQGGQSVDGQSNDPAQTPTGQNYAPGVRPQLPPIGYAPAGGAMQPQYPSGVEQMYQAQSNGQVYAGYPPHSPYGQGQQM